MDCEQAGNEKLVELRKCVRHLVRTYRRGTQAVACLEIIAATLLFLVSAFILLGLYTDAETVDPGLIIGEENVKNLPTTCISNMLYLQTAFALFFAIESLFHVFAGLGLLNSTKPGIPAALAIEYIRFWRCITLLLYAQYIFFLVVAQQCTFAIELLAIRMLVHLEVEGFKMTFHRMVATARLQRIICAGVLKPRVVEDDHNLNQVVVEKREQIQNLPKAPATS